jgi:hypothetical protein
VISSLLSCRILQDPGAGIIDLGHGEICFLANRQCIWKLGLIWIYPLFNL